MVGPKKLEKILTNVWYVLPYQKCDTPDGIRYSFFKPYDIFIQDITSEDANIRQSLFDKQPDLAHIVLEGIHNPSKVLYDTDPIALRYMDDAKTIKIFTNEDVKLALRRRLNIPTILPNENFNEGLQGSPANIPLYTDDSSTIKIKGEKKKKESKKVTRVCLHEGCSEIIDVYKSQLKQGKGLFCGHSHSNIYRKVKRVTCTCKTCSTEFQSIIEEDYCCRECDPKFEMCDQN